MCDSLWNKVFISPHIPLSPPSTDAEADALFWWARLRSEDAMGEEMKFSKKGKDEVVPGRRGILEEEQTYSEGIWGPLDYVYPVNLHSLSLWKASVKSDLLIFLESVYGVKET